jgi:ketosteroid isomerase-like protein
MRASRGGWLIACICGLAFLEAEASAQAGPVLTRVVPAADSATAHEILRRTRAWHDAIIRADTAYLNRLILPEYSLTIPPALETAYVTRDQWLANTPAYQLRADRWESSDVRVMGDAAVVTSRFWQHATPRGRDRSGYFLLTDLWRRVGGEWRPASRFSTWLDDPRGPMGSAADVGEAAGQVRALDARWAQAYAEHDTAFALQLMSEDFVMTSTNGGLKDRALELRDVRGDDSSVLHYFRSRDVDVRVHGDVAVVTGRLEWSFTYNGGTSDVARRYTATYVRGGPLGWRLVALHVGRVPEN